MVTVKDVAQDAGVSVGTVSNVLNGANVSEKRRILVEESIRKLGYQVNTLARGMRAQRTNQVVVLLPNITNPLFALLLADLERALSAEGKQVLLCLSDGDIEKEAKYIRMAGESRADGIIGVTFSGIEEYVTEEMPFVSYERHFQSGIPCVSSDNFHGGVLAAENLVRRGAKNLLFFQIISSVDNEVRKRRRGFESYCAEHAVNYGCVEFSEKQVASIYSAFSSRNLVRSVLEAYILNEQTDAPIDGIFAGTDHLAVIIVDELRALGRRVPEDVQVVGYDGLRFMNQGQPVVSSIYQDTGLIAETCVKCLLEILNGERAENHTELEVRFVEGGTTLPLPEDIKE